MQVVIVGGGPAGCAAAILLAEQGIATTIIERTAYNNVRIGETLPPQMAGLLAKLGVSDAFRDLAPLPFSHINSAWAQETLNETDLMFQPHGRGWHIRRSKFDGMLAKAAVAAGARLLVNTRAHSIRRTEAGVWAVETLGSSGQALLLHADFLIDATGHSRKISRQLHIPVVNNDVQVALLAYVKTGPFTSAKTDTSLIIETVKEGWLYSSPVDQESRVVAMLASRTILGALREPRRVLENTLSRSHYIAEWLSGYVLPETVVVHPVWSRKTAQCCGDNWVAIGDAAMMYDPLSGMGLTKAIADGIRVAEALIVGIQQQQTIEFSQYARQQSAAFSRYRKMRCAYYRMERRWAGEPFWSEMHGLGQ